MLVKGALGDIPMKTHVLITMLMDWHQTAFIAYTMELTSILYKPIDVMSPGPICELIQAMCARCQPMGEDITYVTSPLIGWDNTHMVQVSTLRMGLGFNKLIWDIHSVCYFCQPCVEKASKGKPE